VNAEQEGGKPGAGTRERILDGALRAIGQDGVRSLSMRKIGEAAGVSRGTVYLYFNNTGEVLRAVWSYDHRKFDEGTAQVLSRSDVPKEQLRGFLEYCHRYLTLHPTRWMVKHESRLLLQYLDEQMPSMRAGLKRSLEPIFTQAPAVQSGRLSTDQLADLTLRALVSAYLLPAGDPEAPLETILELFDLPDEPPISNHLRTQKKAANRAQKVASRTANGAGRPKTASRRRVV
jgi:AcrR family transcriptional regulator